LAEVSSLDQQHAIAQTDAGERWVLVHVLPTVLEFLEAKIAKANL
jgi:hypothetical protein